MMVLTHKSGDQTHLLLVQHIIETGIYSRRIQRVPDRHCNAVPLLYLFWFSPMIMAISEQ